MSLPQLQLIFERRHGNIEKRETNRGGESEREKVKITKETEIWRKKRGRKRDRNGEKLEMRIKK